MRWAGIRARSPLTKVSHICLLSLLAVHAPYMSDMGFRLPMLFRDAKCSADHSDGWAEFLCPPESISIWTKTDARGREEFKK